MYGGRGRGDRRRGDQDAPAVLRAAHRYLAAIGMEHDSIAAVGLLGLVAASSELREEPAAVGQSQSGEP